MKQLTLPSICCDTVGTTARYARPPSAVPKVDGKLWLKAAEEFKDLLELLSNEEPGTMAPDMWEILLFEAAGSAIFNLL